MSVSTVADLAEVAGTFSRSPISVHLSDITVTEDEIRLPGRDPFILDTDTTLKISKFFKAPGKYFTSVSPDIRAICLNHEFNKRDGFVNIFTANDEIVGFQDPDKKSFPLGFYLDAMTNHFDGDDKVTDFRLDGDLLLVDVVQEKAFVDVPGNGAWDRPLNVGDISHGGVRLIAYPDQDKAPSLSSYVYRLVCSNGLTVPSERKVTLRGNTLEDIDREFNDIIANLKIEMGSVLDEYAATANIPVEGEISRFVYNLADEAGLSQKVTTRVLDLSSNLNGGPTPTVYDVTQIFTQVANEEISFRSRLALQGIGGELAGNTEHALNRCNSCQHPFVDFDRV